jgi:hypothetical protein
MVRMKRSPVLLFALLSTLSTNFASRASEAPGASAWLLPSPGDGISLWWSLSSAAKAQPDHSPPSEKGTAVHLRCAKNETEAAQVFIRSSRRLEGFSVQCSSFTGSDGSTFPPGCVDLLQVRYLEISQSSDRLSAKGLWPDPLVPLQPAQELKENFNHGFWIRVFVPANTTAGVYKGGLTLKADSLQTSVPIEITVFDFALPDRMTCTTAFGFSAGNVFRYHGLKTEPDKRRVLGMYWANLAAHHVSPYDPAPLDPIRVEWPNVRPPRSEWDRWTGLRIVTNEFHGGKSALLVYDDKANENVTVSFEPLIEIPRKGLRLKFFYRTAVPGHRFLVTLNHHDAQQAWMSGRNNDIALRGNGSWEAFDQVITNFPAGAKFCRFLARATVWTDSGEGIGLVWIDDLSIQDAETGKDLITGGDFEPKPRTEPVALPDQLRPKLDFSSWDNAMEKAMGQFHFNSFRVDIPGIGGGTFHEISQPNLLGFGEDTPEYPLLFGSYCQQLHTHLREKGWLPWSYVYWFDEPDPDQYPFVMNGFEKLRHWCPGISRMLTEQVEPSLIGGPNIWCSISDNYDHARAEQRRKAGEKFWWYVCTGPKAPYAGLFIDHPAPEMRIWLWQTFQRNIEGILIWETTYWTSSAAYPDADHPQNPYTDSMSWTSGYSTPSGKRVPWGNGDGRFLYPPPAAADGRPASPVMEGPVDSIRWEQLRDGIEDYEYLCILRTRLAARRNSLDEARAREFEKLLEVPETITRSMTDFARDGAPIEEHRSRLAQAITALK